MLPALLVFGTFRIWPIFIAFLNSLHELRIMEPSIFVGLTNYVKMFSSPDFYNACNVTIFMVVASIALILPISFFAAVILNQKLLKAKLFFKFVYFLPVVTAWIVVGFIWRWIFNTDYGVINNLFKVIGLPPQRWLVDSSLAKYSIVFVNSWKYIGFFMIIFLANLQMVNPNFYEAAAIDGANRWQQFIHITVPQLKPAFSLSLIVLTSYCFRIFAVVLVMTEGGPEGTTDVITYYAYRQAFEIFRFGYASAVAVIMFVFVMILTFILVKFTKFTTG